MFFLNYIDPGTGSMLFTVIIGIVTTLFFVLRGVFIKFKYAFRAGGAKEDRNKIPLVIFSDSKRYWNVFKPICDELERRGIVCEYWTASPDDPALSEKYEKVTCRFIGEGNRAFAKLNVMNARVCLATTPGLDVLQWKRSRDTKWYVHVFHALDDGTLYRQFGLDYYDAVLMTGSAQAEKIRKLEQMRNLLEKELIMTGSTYLDNMKKRLDDLNGQDPGPSKVSGKTVLCAPSWGPSSILNRYGESFLRALKDTGLHIIVRPHPQSVTSDPELLEDLREKFPDNENWEWNFDNDNFSVLRRSDLLISDFSGVIFDFCYIFDRPVIYTDTEFDKSPYDADWLEETPWILATLSKIGRELKKEDIEHIGAVIDEVMTDRRYREGRAESKKEIWENIGFATEKTVDYLETKLQQ